MPLPRTIGRSRAMLGASDPALAYTKKVIALSPISYWPMAEGSGTVAFDASGNARNGAYTGVTLGNVGIGDGRTSAAFNGATSKANVYSASLDGALNGQELTIALWCKVASAGVWTDGSARRLFRLLVDASNYVEAYRTPTNNQLEIDYVAGGTVKGNIFSSGGVTSFFHIAVAVSKTANTMKLYFNGVQQGATLTGLGTWAGALSSTTCVFGAHTLTPSSVWSGALAHAAVWNTALSAADITSLAVP